MKMVGRAPPAVRHPQVDYRNKSTFCLALMRLQRINNQQQKKCSYVKRVALRKESLGLPQVRALRMGDMTTALKIKERFCLFFGPFLV
jgi:hypothetical protein